MSVALSRSAAEQYQYCLSLPPHHTSRPTRPSRAHVSPMVIRHNRLPLLYESCSRPPRSWSAVRVSANETNSHRPADICIPGWTLGQPEERRNVTVAHPLNPEYLTGASATVFHVTRRPRKGNVSKMETNAGSGWVASHLRLPHTERRIL